MTRSTVRDVLVLAMLLAAGIAAVIAGVAAVLHDLAAAHAALWKLPFRPTGLAPVGWLRACLPVVPCREAGAAVITKAVTAHAHVLRGGVLAFLAALAWGGMVRGRLASSRRSLITGAHFARGPELRRLTRRSRGAWFPVGYARRVLLPSRSRGAAALVTAAMTAWAQPVCLPEEDLARHVLVVGLTGAHKTTALTFPVLIEAARAGVSVIALDLKYGEEDSLARVAPEWMRCGRDVLVFAPVDPVSLRWNPLAACRTMGEAHRLASLLFDDADTADPDPLYWMGAERHVCAALILAIATDGDLPTLERLRALCAAGPGAVHSYVQTHPAAHSLASGLGAYRAMLAKDEAGILQGIASRLEAWSDEAVCRATGGGDDWEQIDLGRLRREPVLLLVGVPQAARPRLRWLCHLFLQDLASCLLSPRGPHEKIRVLQVLEELPAWGPLPSLADHLATFRSRQVSVLATIQSEAQGACVYGVDGWAAVEANLVTKIYFSSLADLDAERLSRCLGTALTEDVARSRGWGPGGHRGDEHRRQISVPLRRPEELHGAGREEDEILVRSPRLLPARLWCPPFFARPECSERVPNLPPSTADLVVYHHLRYWRTREDAARTQTTGPDTPQDAGGLAACAPHPCPNTIVDGGVPRRAAAPESDFPPPAPVAGGGAATAQDVGLLTRFVERLVNHLTGPRLPDRPRPFVRGVHRIGKLIEVRVDPEVALRLCGDPATTAATIRRWAALRWVRRVRPVFVLEKRAIEALDASLRRRLADACSPEARKPQGGSNSPR